MLVKFKERCSVFSPLFTLWIGNSTAICFQKKMTQNMLMRWNQPLAPVYVATSLQLRTSSEAAPLWEALWVKLIAIFVSLGEGRRKRTATGEHALRKQNGLIYSHFLLFAQYAFICPKSDH